MREQRDFAFIAMLTRVVSLPLPSLLLARRYLAASAVSETGKGKKTKKADAEADGEESHKYAHTVNLPRTEFSMRADAGVREPQMQQICCDSLFAWQRKSRPLATYPQFVMLDGPPFANGPLHVGHFLNKVLKDIINRYKLLQGFGVPYTPGWDCHGLPIEQKALELSQAAARRNKTATTNAALSPTDIRSMCERLATSAINVQRNTFRRWGVMGDWANAYQTMDKQYEATQLGVFGEMVARGLIYRQLKPVHWSPSSRTALAEAELEYKDDHISHAVHIAFDVAQVSADAQAAGVTLQRFPSLKALIWTTTPWTLPANVAICLNAEMQYSIVSVTRDSVKSFLIIASDLVETVSKDLGLELTVELPALSGSLFLGTECTHPTMPSSTDPSSKRRSVLLCGPHVTASAGTGLVHTAPGHGHEDWVAVQSHNFALRSSASSAAPLPVLAPVTAEGKFTADAGPTLVGQSVLAEGNAAVIEQMRAAGALWRHTEFAHRYPVDWRTKKPIIQRACEQWFCRLEALAPEARRALEKVTLVPAQGAAQLSAVVGSRTEWCISRQRHWGMPIPVFYDSETGAPLLTRESVQHVASLVAEHGSGCWWTLPVEELLPPSHRQNGRTYVRGLDTMDVWFDSGVAWRASLQPRGIGVGTPTEKVELQIPAVDVVLEGEDQYRGWFQSLLLTGVACTGQAPYRTVVTHGFVLDEQGRKMSKSLGNVFDPNVAIVGVPSEVPSLAEPGAVPEAPAKAKGPAPVIFGADVLRLWVASTDYTSAVSIGSGIINKVLDSRNKLRNSLRFLLGVLHDFSTARAVPVDQLLPIDRCFLHELRLLQQEIDAAYESFSFIRVTKAVNTFVSADLSAFYSSVVKLRLYCEASDSITRRSAQTVLFETLQTLMRALAPIINHTIEEVYQSAAPALQAALRSHNSFQVPEASKLASDNLNSVFCHGWFHSNPNWKMSEAEVARWKAILDVRACVNRALESARSKKLFGSSLEAELELRIGSPALRQLLDDFQTRTNAVAPFDALEELFIVSSVRITDATAGSSDDVVESTVTLADGTQCSLGVIATRSARGKCSRCRAHKPLINVDLCPRCAAVVAQSVAL